MPLSMKLENRIALVTGGGSGLGRAISLLFAEEGAQVVVNDVRRETAEQTVAQMKGPAGRRAILNLSSVAALMGLEVAPHYSAAKGAILAFTRAVARDAASRGIRVNAICPGYIDTPMTEPMSPLIKQSVTARTPLGRTGTPNEVAATALFLASDDSSFYTGQWLSPNGGLFIG